MIIPGGENMYSTEVETVLASLPAVAGCAVIEVPEISCRPPERAKLIKLAQRAERQSR